MSERMKPERLAELEKSYQKHFDSLCAEYKCELHDITNRSEREAWELLQALKAERAWVKFVRDFQPHVAKAADKDLENSHGS